MKDVFESLVFISKNDDSWPFIKKKKQSTWKKLKGSILYVDQNKNAYYFFLTTPAVSVARHCCCGEKKVLAMNTQQEPTLKNAYFAIMRTSQNLSNFSNVKDSGIDFLVL